MQIKSTAIFVSHITYLSCQVALNRLNISLFCTTIAHALTSLIRLGSPDQSPLPWPESASLLSLPLLDNKDQIYPCYSSWSQYSQSMYQLSLYLPSLYQPTLSIIRHLSSAPHGHEFFELALSSRYISSVATWATFTPLISEPNSYEIKAKHYVVRLAS